MANTRKFDTKYTRDNSKQFSCPGSETVIDYELRVVDNVPELVEVGKHNIQDLIDSYRDTVDLKVLIARYNCGDISALNGAPGIYADITGMPETYAELVNRNMIAEQYFEKLPAEIKEQFGNNQIEFWNEYGTENWQNKLKAAFPDDTNQISQISKEVKTNE